jgi:hypothetical protein
MPTLQALALDRGEVVVTKTKTMVGVLWRMDVWCAMHWQSQPESGRETAQKKDEKTCLSVKQKRPMKGKKVCVGIFSALK